MFADFVRPMQPGEDAAVEALLKAGFEGDAEARLVQALRKAGDMAGEMVLPMGDKIIGYYALSTMRAPASWLALAPVAIHPDHQGRGHGRRAVRRRNTSGRIGYRVWSKGFCGGCLLDWRGLF